MKRISLAFLAFALVASTESLLMADTIEILNVSYDPTRELFQEFNQVFAKHWKEKTGQTVIIRQSHGGSGSQARAVIDGLQADVVTLALALDVDILAEKGLLSSDWQSRLPHNSAPYTSTLALLVRAGNPKNIKSWEDLARPDVKVITPNPKTSGVARWNYLVLWGYVLRRELGEDYLQKIKSAEYSVQVAKAQQRARQFVTAVYRNVPVLDRAARGATNTFVQRGIGDVLINWENEILLSKNELDSSKVEIVVPETSILAETVVAVVDQVVDRRGTRTVAEAYLKYLYSKEGQEIVAKNYYRPASAEVADKYKDLFPQIELFTINQLFGSWSEANRLHFVDGGEFDNIYTAHD